MTRYPALVTSPLVVGLALGCTAILDFPEEVTGYRWCLDAEPAKGRRNDDLSLIDITYAVSNNWTRACTCMCAADHQIMLQGANGELTPGSEDALWYELQVGQLRASAVTECEERAAALADEHATVITFDDPAAVSCLDSLADEPAYFAEECVLFDDLCPPGAPGGFDTDGYIPGESGTAGTDGSDTGADTTGMDDTSGTDGTGDTGGTSDDATSEGAGLHGMDDWSIAIDCSARGHCDIDAALVQAVLAEPGVLADERVRVRAGVSRLGRHGVHFIEIDSGSLPAALGLESGYVLWRVNEIELRSRTDVLQALDVLMRATGWTVEIDRGERTVVRTYRVVEGRR